MKQKCDFQCETSPDHLLLYIQTDLGLLSRKTKSNIGAGHQTSFLSKALNSIWHIVSQGFWTRIVRERTRSGFWTQKRFRDSFGCRVMDGFIGYCMTSESVQSEIFSLWQELYSDGKEMLEACVAEKRRYDAFLQVINRNWGIQLPSHMDHC